MDFLADDYDPFDYHSFAERDPAGGNPAPPLPVAPPAGSIGGVFGTPLGTLTQPKTGGGGGGGGGSFDPGSFPDYDFGPLPQFHAPKFVAPTAEDVLNSPDYQSRLRSGTDALERSAAARGTLRTGGTLKDIIDYGKKFGQGEYDSSFNHSLAGFQANYQGAHDEFAPQLAGYQLRAQAALAKALAIYNRGTSWNNPHAGGGGGGGSVIPDDEPIFHFQNGLG